MTETLTKGKLIYKDMNFDNYFINSNGIVINKVSYREMKANTTRNQKAPYVSVVNSEGHSTRIPVAILVYNAFSGDPNPVDSLRKLRFKDGNSENVDIDNICKKDSDFVTVRSSVVEDGVMKIEFNEYSNNEFEFAKLQKNIIDLLGSNSIRKRIRQNAMEKVNSLYDIATEESVAKYELEYIMEIQRSKSIYNLPLFTSETLVGVYHEYSDILPVIDSTNILEVVYMYIEDMRSNAIISLDVKHTGTTVHLKDFNSDELTYTVSVDPLNPIKSFLAIIRLRNILKVSLNPETLIPLY